MSRILSIPTKIGAGISPTLFTGPRSNLFLRFASTTAVPDKKKYSATLLLPKTSLPLRHKNPAKIETKYRDRTTYKLYREQYASNTGKTFILHDGPPYANGNLHMGHALNKILKDIINRYNVIRGRKVHYIPGWDCHGLPIEHKALAALGKSHTALDPVSVRQEARKFALQAIDVQKAEMKLLGVMADWDAKDGVYRTLDPSFEIRQLRLFQKMVAKGFITHRLRPTYYSPSSKTALAEAELEYKDLKSTSVFVAFPVEDMTPRLREAHSQAVQRNPNAVLHLAIWTTTPWSLPGNMGVAVGSDIDYVVVSRDNGQLLVVAEELLEDMCGRLGKLEVVDRMSGNDLVGTTYSHIFQPSSSTLPRPSVFPASYVTAQSGTGLVHSAPAHGHDDYDSFHQLGLLTGEMRCPVDDDGCFTDEVRLWSDLEDTTALVGKPVLKQGTKAMVELLESNGVLLAKETIEHRYPCDWRTKEPIIIRTTPQWFADVDSLKGYAQKAMEHINFVPPTGHNRLSATVLGRSEWCISRQRSWGVPIPALYTAKGDAILTEESLAHILGVLEDKGIDHWWSGPIEDFVPPFLTGETLTRGFDTLDVWFDSGTSWSLIEAAELRSPDQPLADVYLEGSDQHRGWFQSSLLTRLASQDGSNRKAPYANLITHGFTTDETGAKMSKSLGNGLSPIDVINGTKDSPAHGSDTLRVWAAGVDYTRDSAIGPTSISHASELLRKMRSALRFMLGNIANVNPQGVGDVNLSLVDRYILHELNCLETRVEQGYEEFAFNKVLQNISTFTSSTLSSFYFDVVKDTLYCDPSDSERRQAVLATLKHVFTTVLKMTAPIAPHLAEEVYEAANPDSTGRSVLLDSWSPETTWIDQVALDRMSAIIEVRNTVLGLLEAARQAKHLRSGSEAGVSVETTDELAALLKASEPSLAQILGVSTVSLTPQATSDSWQLMASATTDYGPVKVTLNPASRHQCPRCWLYTAETESLCQRCDGAVSL